MSYNEKLAQRVREILFEKNVVFAEKRMFGGLCFMVDDKMCCGLLQDKNTEEDLFMCRIGQELYNQVIELNHVRPMDFTNKPMKGYIYATSIEINNKKNLSKWVQYCLDFNPLANKRGK